jgi:hypothetical protein
MQKFTPKKEKIVMISNTYELLRLANQVLTMDEIAKAMNTHVPSVFYWLKRKRRCTKTKMDFENLLKSISMKFAEFPEVQQGFLNVQIIEVENDRSVFKPNGQAVKAKSFLTAELSDGRQRPFHVLASKARKLGVKDHTLRRVGKQLGVQSEVSGFGTDRISLWQIPLKSAKVARIGSIR